MIGTTTCVVYILKLKSVLYYKHHVVMTTEKTNPMSPMAIRTYLSKRSKVLDNVIAVAVREKELLRIESDIPLCQKSKRASTGRDLSATSFALDCQDLLRSASLDPAASALIVRYSFHSSCFKVGY